MSLRYQIKGVRKIVLKLENQIFNFIYKKKLGNKVKIFGFPLITIEKGANLKVGKNVVFCSNSYFNSSALNHSVALRLLTPNAKLVIGDRVGVNGACISVTEEVIIGNEVLIGVNAFIADSDFHPVEPENRRSNKENIKVSKVVIEDNVFIGMNALVLKGVTIGHNSIVAAGSIVTKNIPPNEIWGGNPAKFIRKIQS